MTKAEALDLLELTIPFTEDRLRQQYRDFVLVWHPDRFKDNHRLQESAEQKLKKINEAFSVLESEFSSTDHLNQARDERKKVWDWTTVHESLAKFEATGLRLAPIVGGVPMLDSADRPPGYWISAHGRALAVTPAIQALLHREFFLFTEDTVYCFAAFGSVYNKANLKFWAKSSWEKAKKMSENHPWPRDIERMMREIHAELNDLRTKSS